MEYLYNVACEHPVWLGIYLLLIAGGFSGLIRININWKKDSDRL